MRKNNFLLNMAWPFSEDLVTIEAVNGGKSTLGDGFEIPTTFITIYSPF